jgi:hypothetical protein
MKKYILYLLQVMLVGLVAAATPPSKAKRAKIAISTRLDKTAIWVGDMLEYTIRAVHDKDVEFVMDNLKAENLNLAPFVVRDIAVRQHSYGSDKNLLEVTLSLTSYEIGKPELRIPAFILYYFVRAPGFEKRSEAQAESAVVPATRVGLRSTLPGDNPKLRDFKEPAPTKPQKWIMPLIVGLSGVTFLALYAGKRGWSAVREARRPKKRRMSSRARARLAQEFLKKIKTPGNRTGRRPASVLQRDLSISPRLPKRGVGDRGKQSYSRGDRDRLQKVRKGWVFGWIRESDSRKMRSNALRQGPS